MKYQLRVEFPDRDLETANLHIILRPPSSRTAVKLLVQFDGIEAVLVGHEPVRLDVFTEMAFDFEINQDSVLIEHDKVIPEDVAASFASQEALNQLMQTALASFKYSHLGSDNRNAGEFFPTGWLQVTLIEYAGLPVLVAS
jgi:hypothetical protein